MIIGILRVIYFFGPIMSLAVVVMNKRSNLAWYLWGFSALIVALYWIFLLSAEEDGAVEVSLIPITIWTPLLLTTLIAGLTRPKWIGLHNNPSVSQILVVLVCLIPSAIGFFLFL